MTHSTAKFSIGEIVRHRLYPFRGVVVDVDPEFDNTDEWYESIPPEVRPHKEQPFYHLLAENADSYYTAYVSQQNLVGDGENGPVGHHAVWSRGPTRPKRWHGHRHEPACRHVRRFASHHAAALGG